MDKKVRRQVAIKKAKQKNAALIIGAIVVAVVFGVLVIFSIFQSAGSEVYLSGSNHVTLYKNNRFKASLPHNVAISGTYEIRDGESTKTVAFSSKRGTETGMIDGDVLSMPTSWADSCGHSLQFKKR